MRRPSCLEFGWQQRSFITIEICWYAGGLVGVGGLDGDAVDGVFHGIKLLAEGEGDEEEGIQGVTFFVLSICLSAPSALTIIMNIEGIMFRCSTTVSAFGS